MSCWDEVPQKRPKFAEVLEILEISCKEISPKIQETDIISTPEKDQYSLTPTSENNYGFSP